MIQITVSMMSRCYVAALYAILLFWRQPYEGSAPQDKIFDMLFFLDHIHFFWKQLVSGCHKPRELIARMPSSPSDKIHDLDKHFFETQYLAISEVFPGYHDQNILL